MISAYAPAQPYQAPHGGTDYRHAPPTEAIPLRFTGTASEYFRIWIVNVLLSVLTLGIYSAWAKVRTKQYFYRNTWLQDSTFEYVADPIGILKGRVLMATFLILLVASQHYEPGLYLFLMGIGIIATPWVVAKALAFNARNSMFRNIRFAFVRGPSESYGAYLGGGLVYLVTCGLGMPYFQWRISQFAVEGHRYGQLPFYFRTDVGRYFNAFLIGFLTMIPIAFVWFLLALTLREGFVEGDTTFVILPMFYALLLVPAAYLKATIANLFWGGIHIDRHELTSNQRFGEVLWLMTTNVLAVLFSLGLAYPWAKIRSMRYLVEHLTLHADGPLHTETGYELQEVGAFGDAATDLGDFDMDFG
ncbi:MAG: DUF898 domain-containing protein [Myxococcales bacterium]|nr:DUF898 domain-containing protein [Myxococcales bacterium]